MSVRKLSNVQKARRILRRRRQRCAGVIWQENIERALPEVDADPQTGEATGIPFGFSKRMIEQSLRDVARHGFPYGILIVQPRRNAGYSDMLSAARRKDGNVVWQLHRQEGLAWGTSRRTLPMRGDNAKSLVRELGERMYGVAPLSVAEVPTTSSRVKISRRCPCSTTEMVAIDTLLETGDHHAERLAKACKRGGGVLEGPKPKRRRRP